MPSDVSIQNKPLKIPITRKVDFMKMTLTNPSEGFGSSIYPYVVSDVAILNAKIISSSKPDYSKIAPPPSKPFVPKVKLLTANYSASVSYDFTDAASLEGLDFFYLTPFRVLRFLIPRRSVIFPLLHLWKGLPPMDCHFGLLSQHRAGPCIAMCRFANHRTIDIFYALAKKWAASHTQFRRLKVSYAYANATSWSSWPCVTILPAHCNARDWWKLNFRETYQNPV